MHDAGFISSNIMIKSTGQRQLLAEKKFRIPDGLSCPCDCESFPTLQGKCLETVRAAGSDDDKTLHSTSIPYPSTRQVTHIFPAECHPNQNTFMVREKLGHVLIADTLQH